MHESSSVGILLKSYVEADVLEHPQRDCDSRNQCEQLPKAKFPLLRFVFACCHGGILIHPGQHGRRQLLDQPHGLSFRPVDCD
jgi:hypothetical protein